MKLFELMGSTISKIADEIRLHGSWEAAQEFNEEQARKWMHTERPDTVKRRNAEAQAISAAIFATTKKLMDEGYLGAASQPSPPPTFQPGGVYENEPARCRPKSLIPTSRQPPPPPPAGRLIREGGISQKRYEMPPLGIMPLHVWIAERYRAVNDAIERCRGTGFLDPIWIEEREWLEELLNDAIRDYKNGNRENINTCRNCRWSAAPGTGQQGK